MALQINTTLTTDSGFTVPSGAYVKFEIRVKTGFKYMFLLNVYRNESAFNNGEATINVIEFGAEESGVFSSQEITDLGSSLAYLQGMLIDKMEAKIGQTGIITAV
jgi:hypothetical protein